MKFLIIQTSFIGDCILATSIVEKLHQKYPDASIYFFLRKGNEGIFQDHPFVKTLVWNKNNKKFKNLLDLIFEVRKIKFDYVINLHRFFNSGLISILSGAKQRIGFASNPLSIFYTKKLSHQIGLKIEDRYQLEIERNQKLIEHITDEQVVQPKIYPNSFDYEMVKKYQNKPYITISPASVWFTKQYPVNKWVELIESINNKYTVYLLGANKDIQLCEKIVSSLSDFKKHNTQIKILAGELSLLQSTSLMQSATINFTNDSAPLHLASAIGATVAGIFCSTTSEFGYTPSHVNSLVIETKQDLSCRPCGLHGHQSCPQKHFLCSNISKEQIFEEVNHKLKINLN